MNSESSIDRTEFRLENWKRGLIDLSRRNRLLNYNPNTRKTITIEIVDEIPQQIFRQLMAGDSFQFDPRPEEELDLLEENEERSTRHLEKGQSLQEETTSELDQHHWDDRLQTSHLAERLQKNLINISRHANESIEEQGINTLFLTLGMLEWFESEESEEVQRSPLLMVPVELKQVSATSVFRVRLGSDDPVINPALVEKMQLDFSVTLPELPELSEDLDVDNFFKAIHQNLSGFPKWRLTSDVVLSLFSFQKFIMYRDLEKNGSWFQQHDVIRALCREYEEGGGQELPDDVMQADLDEEMSPWDTIQVLDADSSQQRAMLAIRKGHHLVIEGPPGTGKSQTIANLIVDSMFQGKTVLFVSEKMAALEVVKDRIDAVGLGEFCLELHSRKGSKREFVRQLSHSMDASIEVRRPDNSSYRRLQELTRNLKSYVVDLHKPVFPLGYSPFGAFSELIQVEDAPSFPFNIKGISGVALDRYEEILTILNDMIATLNELGNPLTHPLRGFRKKIVGRGPQRQVEDAVSKALNQSNLLASTAKTFAEFYGLAIPKTIGDIQVAIDTAECISDSPGGDAATITGPDWEKMAPVAHGLVSLGRKYSEEYETTTSVFKPTLLKLELGALHEEFQRVTQPSLVRFIRPAFWRKRKELASYFQEADRKLNIRTVKSSLATGAECQEHLREIKNRDEEGSRLLGTWWSSETTDWEMADSFINWTKKFQKIRENGIVLDEGISNAATAGYGGGKGSVLRARMGNVRDDFISAFVSFSEIAELDAECELSTEPDQGIENAIERLQEISDNMQSLKLYGGYLEVNKRLDETPAAGFVNAALENGVELQSIVTAFKKKFLELWMDYVLKSERPALGIFQSEQHEAHIFEFRDLDKVSKTIARDRVRYALSEKRQELLHPDNQDQLNIIQRESRKQRRILPIRKLMHRAHNAMQYINPCFMMSPLSVAQFIDPEKIRFDLLVFDEASQIPPADAVGSIIRADQIVVVGDSKQLPPTNFFNVHLDDADIEEDEEIDLLHDLESILDEVATAGVPKMRLKWHYRSQHESLIRFSNEEFYSEDPLYVFPSPYREDDFIGLKFEYVPNGVYQGRGENPIEARVVAEAVIDHIKHFPNLSLGVGTFGIKQQTCIQDELLRLRRSDPSVEWFFQQQGEQKFFVKNLESIQGDDRDVIFLSVTFGPDSQGTISRNFGPINKVGGWRRLNVLTTRAKRMLKVFSSMHGDEIDISNIARGAVLLHQFLTFAETGKYRSSRISVGGTESPFEAAVMMALQDRGYQVITQVGDAGYRVDLGVLDQKRPGRLLCGIECDGATYHSAETVRERDRLRQEVLENRDWVIHRVWSTDWFNNPKRQIDRLCRLIEETHPPQKSFIRKQATGDDSIREHYQEDAFTQVETKKRAVKTDLADIPVEDYRFIEVNQIGEPQLFYSVPTRLLQDVVKKIIDIEGPIHIEELARRAASFWGMHKAGREILKKVNSAARGLCTDKIASNDGEFYSMSDQLKVTVRSRNIEGVNFKSHTIPPSEVEEAIRLLLQHRAPLLNNEIITETAKLLGFARTGRILRELIESALEQLETEGELRVGGKGFHLRVSGS